MGRATIAKWCTAVTMLSVIAVALLAVGGAPWWGATVAVTLGILAFLAGSLLRRHFRTVTRPLGIQRDYRAGWLMLGSFVAVRELPGDRLLVVVVLVLGLALIYSETSLAPRWSRLYPPVRNLPGARAYPAVRPMITAILVLELVGVLGLFVAPKAGISAVWFALAVIGSAGILALILTAIAFQSGSLVQERRWESVAEYEPRFALYFSAPGGSEYQVRMWLAYLEQIGEPWLIILRERRYLDSLAAQTTAPVVVAPTLAALSRTIVPSLTTVFYVNNSFKNSHCVRYAECTHVQLLHGDSDKAPSFNPVTAMYDKVFVAGQAGIDRYAQHGVDIPRRKFEIVGRPQVEGIEPGRARDDGDEPGRRPTILYAPTWQGYHEDANYSSLPVAEEIVRALIDVGADVIFRPHPSSADHAPSAAVIAAVKELLRDAATADSAHRFGRYAEETMALTDCMNLSDGLITDVSSVPGDYLFSQKPFVMVKMMAGATGEEFEAEFPLAAAAYVWDPQTQPEFSGTLAAMLGEDPLRARRKQLRDYYLGPFDSAGYSENFVAAARELVHQHKTTLS